MTLTERLKEHVIGYSVFLVSATVAFCILIGGFLHSQVMEAKDATIERLRADLESARQGSRGVITNMLDWHRGELNGTNGIYFTIGTNKYWIMVPIDQSARAAE